MNKVAISVIIPTYCRTTDLAETLTRVLDLSPAPDEVIVHIDAGDNETLPLIEERFSNVLTLKSQERMGPGGGRNKLIRQAKNEIILSLDDDSWPVSSDFLRSASSAFDCPDPPAVIDCHIIEKDDPPIEEDQQATLSARPTYSFVGCGAVIRKSAFLQTSGYLPLQYAYGMEEADVSLQLIDLGYEISHRPGLRVFHNCERETHHHDPRINAAQITNTMLLAFLRYPWQHWLYGLAQTVNRISFSVRKRRFRGIIRGIALIPAACWRHRKHRSPVQRSTIRQIVSLKRGSQDC